MMKIIPTCSMKGFLKVLCIGAIFTSAMGWLYLLASLAPSIETEVVVLNFPKDLDQLRSLARILSIYFEANPLYVISLFSSAYLFKQAFMIPGSVVLNILAGALFGVFWGLALCCVLTATGATFSFLISKNFGQTIVESFWPEKVRQLQNKVHQNKRDLIYFLLFLRLFPASPNWILNIISPIAGIPITQFTLSVFIGLIPYNLICVQAGAMITTLKSISDIFTFSTMCQMALIALVALIPGLIAKLKVRLCRNSAVH